MAMRATTSCTWLQGSRAAGDRAHLTGKGSRSDTFGAWLGRTTILGTPDAQTSDRFDGSPSRCPVDTVRLSPVLGLTAARWCLTRPQPSTDRPSPRPESQSTMAHSSAVASSRRGLSFRARRPRHPPPPPGRGHYQDCGAQHHPRPPQRVSCCSSTLSYVSSPSLILLRVPQNRLCRKLLSSSPQSCSNRGLVTVNAIRSGSR